MLLLTVTKKCIDLNMACMIWNIRLIGLSLLLRLKRPSIVLTNLPRGLFLLDWVEYPGEDWVKPKKNCKVKTKLPPYFF